MKNSTIILGAGASIDAGLPSAFDLTEIVYDRLTRQRYGNSDGRQAILFGYVVSKLRARRALQGVSPFLPINIEDAYEPVLRILGRDSDFLADFVYSWDPILDQLKPNFDERAFVEGIQRGVFDQSRSFSRDHISVNVSELGKAAKVISRAVNTGYRPINDKMIASLYLSILVDILTEPKGGTEYISTLSLEGLSPPVRR